jgi:hypothetical protein
MIIQTYLYSNKVVAQIVDPTIFTTRNRVVYARPVTVYQGIDNPMQVLVKNQDQKYVDVTNYSMVAEIQDPNNKVAVATFPITWANVTLGQGNFTIDKAMVNSLEQRFYKLTFRTVNTVNGIEQPIYVDSDYDVPLDLKVLPAYYNMDAPTGAFTVINPNAGDTILDGGAA